jgi:hypothetical protein
VEAGQAGSYGSVGVGTGGMVSRGGGGIGREVDGTGGVVIGVLVTECVDGAALLDGLGEADGDRSGRGEYRAVTGVEVPARSGAAPIPPAPPGTLAWDTLR